MCVFIYFSDDFQAAVYKENSQNSFDVIDDLAIGRVRQLFYLSSEIIYFLLILFVFINYI